MGPVLKAAWLVFASVACAGLIGTAATLGRYTLVATGDRSSVVVYRLDRWTGSVVAINMTGMAPVKVIEPKSP